MAQLDALSILLVGATLLACGSGGLVVVRLSNRRLRGLGWLGGAFAAGGFGALLYAVGNLPPFVDAVVADVSVLLAFALVHVAILEMRRAKSLIPVLGLVLLGLQALSSGLQAFVFHSTRGRVVAIGLLVALQVGDTGVLLVRGVRGTVRMPAWFIAAILFGFMGINLFRSFALLFLPFFRIRSHAVALQTATFLVFLATALGIAFGFFWMTTAELSNELEKMASIDSLTKIFNRRVFREWCDKEMARSSRTGTTFSILMMDLDHFKQINDEFGHLAGDQVLCAMVGRMKDSVREIDIVARWGGEEFVALLPGASLGDALQVAQRVRANVEVPLDWAVHQQETREMRITVSVGVAAYRGGGDSLDDVFHRADAALYLAKAAGRNRALTMV